MADKGELLEAHAEPDLNTRVERALASDVPKIYFNGFVNSLTGGDIVTILEINGRPAAVLNMSFTVAKSLAVGLGQIIGSLEERTDRSMLTSAEIDQAMLRKEVP